MSRQPLRAGSSATIAPRPPLWRRMAIPSATWLVGVAMAGIAVWFATRATIPPPRVSRFLITPPSAAALTVSGVVRDLALTPDGTRLVYVGANGTALFVRALDQLDATPLTGLGAPFGPFVSPDGQWIGFFDGASRAEEGRDHRRPGGHARSPRRHSAAVRAGARTARSSSRPTIGRRACSGSPPRAASRPC